MTNWATIELFDNLAVGEYCYVLNSRQMGKSSLCVRIIERLKRHGSRTAFCDLTRYGGRNLTAEQWYAALLSDIGRELGLRTEFLAAWKENASLPPVQRLFSTIKEVALRTNSIPTTGEEPGNRQWAAGRSENQTPNIQYLTPNAQRLVIFIDEIDVTLSLPFDTDEFFAAIRECYVGRAVEERLKRLSFCLLGTATPADLIKDTRVSPFNIGKRVEVRDFTAEEAAPLAEGLAPQMTQISAENANNQSGAAGSQIGNPAVQSNHRKLLDRVLYWTGGHPYLTQRLCLAVAEASTLDAQHPTSHVDKICRELFLTHRAKETDDNLTFVRNRLLRSEVDLPALLDLYGRMRSGRRVPYDETNPLCPVLRLSGVAKVRNGLLEVRNRIYAQVFDTAWIEAHMPDAELRRQKAAYHRGLVRALGFSGLVLAVVVGLALTALNTSRIAVYERQRADRKTLGEADQRRLAQSQAEDKRRLLYFADMNLIPQCWEDGDIGHAQELLNRHRDDQYLHGFEWQYLLRLCKGEQRLTIRTPSCTTMSYSQDGRLLATGDVDAKVRLWDANTGRERAVLGGHKTRIVFVAFSPDGRTLISCGQDESVRIWNVATRSSIWSLPGTNARTGVFDISFSLSPDGGTLAVGHADGRITFRNLRSHELLLMRLSNGSQVNTHTFSPDGKSIVVGSEDGMIRRWDVGTGQLKKAIHAHTGGVYVISFSSDGSKFASGGLDQSVRIWDVATGKRAVDFEGHRAMITDLRFSLDGKTLVSSGGDNVIKVWDVTALRERATLRGHAHEVTSIAISPDGRSVASGSFDWTLRFWDIGPSRGRAVYDKHTDWVYASASSPNGNIVATGGKDSTVRIWDTALLHTRAVIAGRKGSVLSLAFSPDGATLAVAGGVQDRSNTPGELTLWDSAKGRRKTSLQGHRGCVFFAAFTPDGKTLITTSNDRTLRYWDAASGVETYQHQFDDTMALNICSLSHDGATLVLAGPECGVKFWDVRNKQELGAMEGKLHWTFGAAVSPDNKTAAIGENKRVTLVDMRTHATVAVLSGHKSQVSTIAFSPDGRTLVTGGLDHDVKLWNFEKRTQVTTLKGHTAPILSIAFSPDGKTMVSTDGNHKVLVWRGGPSDAVAESTSTPPN